MTKKHILLCGASALAMGMFIAPAFAQEEGVETVVVTGIRASLQSAQAIKQNADQVVDAITAVDIGALPDNSVAEALQRVPGVQITRTDAVNDPLRWAGFGNGVFIRGLSWVKSLTNGEETFGATDGRNISFADISADLMSGVDVYKNPTAKMVEGGVGGTVDLKTRKPFDTAGRLLAVSGDVSMGLLSDHATPSVNALYSDRFQTGIGEFGVLVSADYQNLLSTNNVVSADPWTAVQQSATWQSGPDSSHTAPADATNYPYLNTTNSFPRGYTNKFGMIGYRHMDWKQPRVALDATIQWRPTEALEISFTAIYSKAEPQSNEHNVAWIIPVSDGTYTTLPSADATSANASMATYKYDSAGYFQSGTIYNAQSNSTMANYFDTRFDVRHHINSNYELNIKYNPTDNLQITVDADYVDSRATMSSMTIYNMVKNSAYVQSSNYSGHASYYPNAPRIDVGVDLTDDSPKLTYDSTGTTALADQSEYLWAAGMDHYENNYAHAYVTRADATYTFDGDGLFGWLKSAGAGVRTNLKQAISRQTGWNWGRMGFETWNAGNCGRHSDYSGNDIDPAVCTSTMGDFSTKMAANTMFYKFPDVFGSKMPGVWEPNIAWMKHPYTVWADVEPTELAYQSLTYSGGTNNLYTDGMWQPLIVKNGANCKGTPYNCTAMFKNATAGVNNQKEDTYAGYFQVDFAHDTLLGMDVPVDGNIGVRIVKTAFDSGDGYLVLPKVSQTSCTGTCKAYNEALTFIGTGNQNSDGSYGGTTVSYGAVKNNYTNVLPSANLRAHLSDTLQLRLAYSQGLVRPDLDKMRNYASLSYSFNTCVVNVTEGTTCPDGTITGFSALTGTAYNPTLKSTYSQNYDASIEWFFSPTGNVSLALFDKIVSNYVMSGGVEIPFTRNGITEKFNVNTYINGNKGKIKGFEFAYQQFFDALPGAWSGLGIQTNFTKIINKGGHNSIDAGQYIGNLLNGTSTSSQEASDSLKYSTDTSLPMEGMSNDSANLALMYEKYGISARVAYNWRSRFLVSSSAVNLFQPVWQRGYGQIDTSVLYSFLDHYKVGIQANNLFKQTTVLEIGSKDTRHKFEWVEGERKLSLVLRANW
jgi:TonB-dependent receptor